MKTFAGAAAAIVIALAPGLAASPAHAQGNDVLAPIQRFLNGGNDQNSNQNAYERGRIDQQRREEAQRERWRAEHADNYNRYPDQRRYENPNYGYNPNQGYNGYYDNGYHH